MSNRVSPLKVDAKLKISAWTVVKVTTTVCMAITLINAIAKVALPHSQELRKKSELWAEATKEN